MTDIELLRAHWADFCNACDPHLLPEDFAGRMEAAGLIYLRRVASADLEARFFATELGIERGSYVYELTESGRRAVSRVEADA